MWFSNYYDMMIEQNILPTKKLKADVVTRWGSTADMIPRIIEQKEAIHVVLGQDRKTSYLVPSWQDLDVLHSVVCVIKPLQEITDTPSGEKRVTCSVVKPLLKVINENILATKDEDATLTQTIKERIATDLRNRYSTTEINLLLDTCSFLDPRFKQDFSTDDEPVHLVMSEMENILKEPPHVQPDSSNVLEPVFEPPLKKRKFSKIHLEVDFLTHKIQ